MSSDKGEGVFYVSESGDDSGAGTPEDPWETLQFAADSVGPGDTVMVLDGSYTGFAIESSGTASQPITFKATGNDVLVNTRSARDLIEVYLADYVVIDGFRVSNAERAGISVLGEPDDLCQFVTIRNCTSSNNGTWGIFTAYAEDVLIEGNECAGSGDEHGIYVSNSADRPVIRRNISHGNSVSGIQINADPALEGDGIITGAVVAYNVIYDNGVAGGAGINLASVRDSLIANNLLYENHGSGIASWDDEAGEEFGSKNNRYFNNTVVMASDGRWAFNLINGSTGAKIKNNIFLHLGGDKAGIETDTSSADGLDSDYNILSSAIANVNADDETVLTLTQWKAQGCDANSFESNPANLFVNPGQDFHLASRADAVDAGVTLSAIVGDLDGGTRPFGSEFDIGCYELGSTAGGERKEGKGDPSTP